jgi:hypothetical protein
LAGTSKPKGLTRKTKVSQYYLCYREIDFILINYMIKELKISNKNYYI